MKKKILYTPWEVNELIEKDTVVIIDIRDKEMYEEGHVQGAVNVPEIFYYLVETTPEGLLSGFLWNTLSRSQRAFIFYTVFLPLLKRNRFI